MIRITELNWGVLKAVYLIIVFVVGFTITMAIIPYIIKIMKKRGHIGIDIHKNLKTEVAESGGISIVIGISIASLFLIIFFPNFFNEILIFVLTVVLSGLIGYIDDRIKLRSRYKLILTIFTGTLIFLANFVGFITIDSPTIPFL